MIRFALLPSLVLVLLATACSQPPTAAFKDGSGTQVNAVSTDATTKDPARPEAVANGNGTGRGDVAGQATVAPRDPARPVIDIMTGPGEMNPAGTGEIKVDLPATKTMTDAEIRLQVEKDWLTKHSLDVYIENASATEKDRENETAALCSSTFITVSKEACDYVNKNFKAPASKADAMKMIAAIDEGFKQTALHAAIAAELEYGLFTAMQDAQKAKLEAEAQTALAEEAKKRAMDAEAAALAAKAQADAEKAAALARQSQAAAAIAAAAAAEQAAKQQQAQAVQAKAAADAARVQAEQKTAELEVQRQAYQAAKDKYDAEIAKQNAYRAMRAQARPLYSLRHPVSGKHLLSLDPNDGRAGGWMNEGQIGSALPAERQNNSCGHNYGDGRGYVNDVLARLFPYKDGRYKLGTCDFWVLNGSNPVLDIWGVRFLGLPEGTPNVGRLFEYANDGDFYYTRYSGPIPGYSGPVATPWFIYVD